MDAIKTENMGAALNFTLRCYFVVTNAAWI